MSHPVGLIESRMFLASADDSTFSLQNTPFGDSGPNTIQSDPKIWSQTAYLPEKSVLTIPFELGIDSADLSRLIMATPPDNDYPDLVDLKAGVWLRMVDPYGKESTTAIVVSQPSFNRETLYPHAYGIPVRSKIELSPFELLENSENK
ncbi:hypothetical protein N9V29_04600 [Flavobacteriales bacterium]|nr:hypothetical protein [Flavobacteriales bacterium]